MIRSVALLVTLFVISAFAANNNIYVENKSGFSLSVRGNQNVPQFEFWFKNGTHYYVRLQHLFEVTGTSQSDYKKVPASEVALPSLDWVFSDIVQKDDSLIFNITGVDAHGRFSGFIFQFHAAGNATSGESKVKFDVFMTDYQWQSKDAAAKLVLAWSMSDSDNTSPDCSSNGSETKFKDAYFHTSTTAQSGSDKINVALVCMNGGAGGLWLVYDHFATSFEHDPEIGIAAASNTGLIVGIIIAVVAAIAIVGVVLYFRRQRAGAYARH